ncbi:co-chaperone DjlA [Thalassotalea ponticola]|uniref:co-chaperone DjlA n=1 Tax=Thalassotalea ponticola TaxID=1523392 RepID=UPI0025B4C7FC|nr:co-chaperone DjlA [Thalassotalea ponticola]MDN3653622.1 co-chaperone DjlA [Thalassotalea ponticola]
MRIWGKVIGFLLGFMAGRVIGALIGLWLGHKIDKGVNFDFEALSNKNEQQRQHIFFDATYSIMGHIAKASGRVSEEEIAFANASMQRWGLNDEAKRRAQSAFAEGKQADFDVEAKVRQLRVASFGRHDLLQMFVEIQIQAAFADGDLHPQERAILHRVAKGLGISSRELDQLLDRIIAGEQFHQQQSPAQQKQQLSNAYRLLGVSEQSDMREVKKAYRKLMSQHHPDKLVAKGLPPELMQDAKQKAQDIQAAYELIAKRRAANG